MSNLGVSEILVILLLVVLVAIPFTLVPYWFIFRKAGFHPALSLLMIVPVASLIMLFFLAFADWPSLKKASQSTD
jgi:hypothetical protein